MELWGNANKALKELLTTKASIDAHRQRAIWELVMKLCQNESQATKSIKEAKAVCSWVTLDAKTTCSVAVKEAKTTQAHIVWEAEAACSAAIRDVEAWRTSQAKSLQREHGNFMQDLEEQVIWEESRSPANFLSTYQVTLYTSPPELKSSLAASYHILLGQTPLSPPFILLQRASPVEEQPTSAVPPTPAPKQSPRPKRWHPSPDPVESMPLGGTTLKVTLGGPPPSYKWWEIQPWDRALKLSCTEVFGQDSDLVKEARREFFSKHSYNFIMEGTHDLSEIFKQMATSAELLGTSIYEIQVSWTGPNELKHANYALQSLPKGLKFLHTVPPSESPKVMGLVGIHDPDALHHFSGVTHCPWCGKEGQNEGSMVNHLQIVHYRLDLVCNRLSWLPIHNGQHSLPPQPAGLLVTWGEKSWQVSFIWATTRRSGTVSAGDPNKEGQDRMVYTRLSYWEYPYPP